MNIVKELNAKIVIAVRLGNDYLSQRALLKFGNENKNLMQWKLDQLIKVFDKDDIIINTPSRLLTQIAKDYNITTHIRDEEISGESFIFSDLVEGILGKINAENIIYINIENPLIDHNNYIDYIHTYKNKVISSNNYDSLATGKIIKRIYNHNNHSHNIKKSRNNGIFELDNGCFIFNREKSLKEKSFITGNPFIYENDLLTSINISNFMGYEVAQACLDIYKQKQIKSSTQIFLDFDGVIFDTVDEAYCITCLTIGKYNKLEDININTLEWKKFCTVRYLVGPAWNYYYVSRWIFNEDQALKIPETPSKLALEFQYNFFKTRELTREKSNETWLSLNKKYPSTESFIYTINKYNNIDIVTNKDKNSVAALLQRNGLRRNINIFDREDYDHYGSKKNLIKHIMKEKNIRRAIFIDDLKSNIDDCKSIEGLEPIHARWGYVEPNSHSDNSDIVLSIITGIASEKEYK